MTYKIIKPLMIVFVLLSFKSIDKKVFEFSYPANTATNISLSTDHFKRFIKEWRGSDYYYYADGDGFICSILYYKLNDGEQLSLVEGPKFATGGPESSPVYPYSYFKNFSYYKELEVNDSSWGKPTDNFMFRQNDIAIEGTKSLEKNMYGYCMFNNDLFVNIHISKMDCSSTDSTDMLEMLKSLSITNKSRITTALAMAEFNAGQSATAMRLGHQPSSTR